MCGGFPEFDFSAMLVMEDDFRALLLGHSAEGVGGQAAKTRAAQLFTEGLRRMQRIAERFRQGEAPPGGDLRALFSPSDLFTFLDREHASNMATTEMMASLATRFSASPGGHNPPGGGLASASAGGAGKVKLNSLLGKWKATFGDACIFHHARGQCKDTAATCSKLHEPPLDKAQVLAWVSANNADISF